MISTLSEAIATVLGYSSEGVIDTTNLCRETAFFMRLGDILLVLTIIEKYLDISKRIRGK